MNRSMLSLLYISLWYFTNILHVNSSELALLYSIKHFASTLDVNATPCLTACPASTPLEHKFNDEISISGDCLFLRDIYEESVSSANNIRLDICDRPFKPVTLYNTKQKKYSIGYELYYDEEMDEELEITSAYANYYDLYRSLNAGTHSNATLSTKPPSLFFVKNVYGSKTKFKLANESMSYVFHWIPVFSIDYSTLKRRILPTYNAHVNDEDCEEDVQNITCHLYVQQNENMKEIFSEKNQQNCLKDLETIVPSTFETPSASSPSFDQPSDQSYNQSCDQPRTQADPYLKYTQILPIWYFRSRSTRLAACSRLNAIPVWKPIADGQLLKIDQHILLKLNEWRKHLKLSTERKFGDIICGTNGLLKLPTKTTSGGGGTRYGDDQQMRVVYLWNSFCNDTAATKTASSRRHIPVPKIIYRIVSVWSRGVAIIIHNTLGSVSDNDLVCPKQDHVPGWEDITNNNSASGLTYTCRLTPEVDYKLGKGVFEHGKYRMLKGIEEQARILLGDYNKIKNVPDMITMRDIPEMVPPPYRSDRFDAGPRYGGGGGGFSPRRYGDYSPRRYGADFSPRRYGSDFSPRRYGADFSPRRYGADFSPRRYGADFSPRRYGADFSPRRYGADFSPRRYGADFSPRRYGADFTPRRFGRDFAATRYARDFDPKRFERDFAPRTGPAP